MASEVKEKRTACNGVDDSTRAGAARHLKHRSKAPIKADTHRQILVGIGIGGPRFDPSLHFTRGQHMPPTRARALKHLFQERDRQVSRRLLPVGTTNENSASSSSAPFSGVKECGGRARAIQRRRAARE